MHDLPNQLKIRANMVCLPMFTIVYLQVYLQTTNKNAGFEPPKSQLRSTKLPGDHADVAGRDRSLQRSQRLQVPWPLLGVSLFKGRFWPWMIRENHFRWFSGYVICAILFGTFSGISPRCSMYGIFTTPEVYMTQRGTMVLEYVPIHENKPKWPRCR